MSQNNSQTVLLSTNNSSSDLNTGSPANVLMSQSNCQTVLSSTAVVKIIDKWNKEQTIRTMDLCQMSNI
ncbi:hypothetical protein NQ317_015410 [Molorchus minor]|uniref:Uncharacterized protein n=1 Tax=Molorchus minor TaxID=1323400 RepID=A0ABQ9IR76_9CUCU|nr:hypothetical protein NQ317_015410 [Molorchus minor]